MKRLTAVAVLILSMPSAVFAQRAKAPADATVFVRLVGSVHAEVEDIGGIRTIDLDRIEIGTGSGFVISPYGYVLTNEHVVSNPEPFVVAKPGERARVTLKISRIDVCFPKAALAVAGVPSQCSEASVTASDPALDLAVLFIGGTNLPYIALGDSDIAAAGTSVNALGYPFGREIEVGKALTAPDLVPEISTSPGAIAAVRTGDSGDTRYLQITNMVNPGNSGGPLLDRDGFALGVIRMRLTRAAGIAFAVPINDAKDFLESHGVSQLLPARRLRLGPLQRIDPKGVTVRLVESIADASPFRSRIESEARPDDVALRIDRVVSPWDLNQIEHALVATRSFEGVSVSRLDRLPPANEGALVLGHALGTAADTRMELAMDYAVLDLGAEKLVARYVGPAEQIAFNDAVLRQSLASLEGQPFLAKVETMDPPGQVEWLPAPAANQLGLPVPAGWIVEPGGPSVCRDLPPPGGVMTTFAGAHFTVALRAAVWPSDSLVPERAAAACGSRRGSSGEPSSYSSRAEWLGVAYAIDGIFVASSPGQVVQLEVVSPVDESAHARALLAAWVKQLAVGLYFLALFGSHNSIA